MHAGRSSHPWLRAQMSHWIESTLVQSHGVGVARHEVGGAVRPKLSGELREVIPGGVSSG